MPTYSYRCTQCETAFDIHQSFSDSSLTECPSCEGRLRKVFSSIGVTFNGSGFYRNDSRSSGKGKGTTDAKSPASTSTSGSSEKAASGSSSGNSSSSSSGSSSKATSAS
ncbi:FmdB family zinc ribbon protein [Cryobacterium tepidiphilum]|uniref:FmdB family transcriptional regulator n=1 Tax=Cryobacterium tepidiphilum TaxID=2486026 RepID=A0A3M8KWG7_9MICO|nr:FmdB family zinc ribbon protein [Cryobacterium tepidiphilum]RNE56999.1 FmdB family transcriptional regulator [Cryobacterium tepidiphilum]